MYLCPWHVNCIILYIHSIVFYPLTWFWFTMACIMDVDENRPLPNHEREAEFLAGDTQNMD